MLHHCNARLMQNFPLTASCWNSVCGMIWTDNSNVKWIWCMAFNFCNVYLILPYILMQKRYRTLRCCHVQRLSVNFCGVLSDKHLWKIWGQTCVSIALFCRPEDVQALISGKLALRYAGRQVYKLARQTTVHHTLMIVSCKSKDTDGIFCTSLP